MKNIFSNKISTKDLYLVTLKQLVEIEPVKLTGETKYIMAKKTEYTICKKKQNSFYDVFTNQKYEYIRNTRIGNHGVTNKTELMYDTKYTTEEELQFRLNQIKAQEEKLRIMNNYNTKTKKLIPFKKKY